MRNGVFCIVNVKGRISTFWVILPSVTKTSGANVDAFNLTYNDKSLIVKDQR